jgi:hypothetical protein
VFVDFVVSGRDVLIDLDLLISAESMPEQAQVPGWKITAVIYPAVQNQNRRLR